MLRRRPDRAEALRLIAFAIAAPFMASGVVLPNNMAPVSTAIGLLIFLVGGVQYHVIQGRRAQFMSRFLSPQVAEMVGRRGLKSATDEQTLELSVVCCDLRGFTAFTAATSSQKVIAHPARVLRRGRRRGHRVRRHHQGPGRRRRADPGGRADPVSRTTRSARSGSRARSASRAWRSPRAGRTPDLRLGVGVGVASGFVTVGVIGAASRLEYTAVGPAVNLASRLCSEAAHGEVLIDGRTIELLGEEAQPPPAAARRGAAAQGLPAAGAELHAGRGLAAAA